MLSYILSLSYFSIHRVFLEHSWSSLAYLEFWSKKAKEEKESTRGHRDQQRQCVFLAGTECMYVFLTSFGMHGICMWFLGYDMSLAWRISWIDNGFA